MFLDVLLRTYMNISGGLLGVKLLGGSVFTLEILMFAAKMLSPKDMFPCIGNFVTQVIIVFKKNENSIFLLNLHFPND